ncbi:PREDICTED: protein FAM161A isoform X2 [Papilio polytes]|uniref:protein FAM161A isoform X2 n=1 Tax=Papilio polytes TaxID=76194 RepID=UPI000675E720|nr:PREDICTED: protein FAM161A isoform X2 [Papilio polytes]
MIFTLCISKFGCGRICRRAITKINSEAELRAQMKPFSFTRREENGMAGVCERAIHVLPKPKKKKRFKARPIPKNLFSNYFYDKKKQDDFFRSMNRRIRAEEMLQNANYPGSMANRDRSRLSTPAAHSDLPVDPSPAAPSTLSSDRGRCSSPSKGCKSSKDDFITTSPQPFRFKTANRANQRMLDIAQKVYQPGKNTDSISDCIAKPRAYSALELKGAAAGRSNLAALLRAESVQRRFEMEAASSLAEQRRRIELRQRDRQLRSKPAWHLVKNNHEEDIAMRLQTRRDEERMRREEFLHEMELMYGRVQQQPLLFERYYAPRSYSPCNIRLSPRKSSGKKRGRRNRSYQMTLSDGFDSDVQKCMDKIENDDKVFGNSDDLLGSIDRSC